MNKAKTQSYARSTVTRLIASSFINSNMQILMVVCLRRVFKEFDLKLTIPLAIYADTPEYIFFTP